MSEEEQFEMEDLKESNSKSVDALDDSKYDWFRCEKMVLCELILQVDSVYQIIGELGELGVCQFKDLNNDATPRGRRFLPELQRCNELEKRLGYFKKELDRESVPIMTCEEPKVPAVLEFNKLESQFEQLEKDLRQINNTRVDLKRRLLEHTELSCILQKVDSYFSEVQAEQSRIVSARPKAMDPPEANLRRRFSMSLPVDNGPEIPYAPVVDIFTFNGSILSTRFNSFERILWILSHGNILLNKFPMEETIEDPETGELQDKTLFILVCQGERLRHTCVKICESYHTNIYNCPEKSSERKELRVGILKEIEELITIIEKSDEHKKNILVAAAKKFKLWQITVAKMKSIYVVMNCFHFTGMTLCGQAWIPETKIAQVQRALIEGQVKSQSAIPSILSSVTTTETPPTWNVSNKFTAGFQVIIDSYGVANYGEVNPAPYACITFPFIFAIMFGDVGHGFIMALFGAWLCWNEQKLASIKDEIFSMFYGGRYIILLMGVFSMYTGLIYNDIFAKSMNIFGSSFTLQTIHNGSVLCTHGNGTALCFPHEKNLSPVNESGLNGYYYPIGIDPIWQLSSNKVLYLNTYKMKMSVIIGVAQMFFGVMLSLANHIHFKKTINIFVEFIPQVIFLLAIFGYMNFMIFYKWFMYSEKESGCAPSILITMINMFMFKQAEDKDPCYLKDPMYEGQQTIQSVLIIIAVLMIPIMLFAKPFYLRSVHRKKYGNIVAQMNDIETHMQMTKVDDTTNEDGENRKMSQIEETETVKEFDFGDALINQAIHTIEYCLGSVSHTASYLRLWALSLAHAQLSEVLWSMVLSSGLSVAPPLGGVVLFFVFAPWAYLTFNILVIMEGLSAFLHALRLHWVEFMSKFYSGSGHEFMPFSFKKIIDEL